MLVHRASPMTGVVNTMDIDITDEQWADYVHSRRPIQHVLPHLPPEEREFLISGYTPDDWRKMFPPE
jgi:hypothetical protein